jgi:hypothetical protein
MDDSNFFFKKADESIFKAIDKRRSLKGSVEGAVRKTGFVEIYGVKPIDWRIPMPLTANQNTDTSTGAVTDVNGTTLLGNTATTTVKTVDQHYKILPVIGTDINDTYSFRTGKAVPTLGAVTIEVDGEFGSLRRATAEFTCYDMDSFDKLESVLLRPGIRIFIRYGYLGADDSTESSQGLVTLSNKAKAYEFVIADYSFTYTKENYIKCSFKAIGVGGLATSINFSNTVNGGTRKFLRDFEQQTTETVVKTVEDVFDYHLVKHLIGVGNAVDSIQQGKSIALPTPDEYKTPTILAMIKLPKDFEVADAIVETNWLNSSYMAYCSLSYIIHHLINIELLRDNPNNLTDGFRNVRYICNAEVSAGPGYNGYIFSADPLNIGITSKNIIQNSYGAAGSIKDVGTSVKSERVATTPDTSYSFDTAVIPDVNLVMVDSNKIDCSMLLVSRLLLRKLLKEFEKDKFSINDFLTKLFDAISDATAGMITLGLYEPDLNSSNPESDDKKLYEVYSQKGKYTPILVKNLKQKPNSVPLALEFDPLMGDGITRSCEVTAKIPKDMAAEAYGRNTPGKTGGTGTDGGQISQVLNQQSKIASTATRDDIVQLITDLKTKVYPENKLSGIAVTEGKSLLKDIMNVYIPLETRLQSEQILYPLEMKLVLDGIEGFRFGDHITTTNIPMVYRRTGGMRVGFTVLRTTHTIAGNNWSTELTTIARLVN